jgi:hypothetical protein
MRALLLSTLIIAPLVANADSIEPCHTPKECQEAVQRDLSFIDQPGFWAQHQASRNALSRICDEKRPGWEAYVRTCASIKRQR